jgi:hypothetical protein
MRAGLCRRLAAVAVAVSIGAGLTVQPAYAEIPATPVVNLGLAALKLFKGNLPAADLTKAVVELIRAVTQTQDQVLARLDAHAAARAVGEAEALSIEMLSYQTIASDEDVLAIFVMDALRSASLDKADLAATTDPRSADQIGHALNVAYLYVMSTIRDAGYTTASVRTALQAYIAGNETTCSPAPRYRRAWRPPRSSSRTSTCCRGRARTRPARHPRRVLPQQHEPPSRRGHLRVHPRTLDYRLRRVHELTGIDPHSVHGIRALSTAAARSRDGTASLGHPR